MLTINKVRFKNFMSYGGAWSEVDFDKDQLTVVASKNGSGKCLDKFSQITVRFANEQQQKVFNDFMKNKKRK